MSKIKSFRGLLEDGEQERISLQTNNGMTGYRIVKFELCGNKPGAVSQESVVKIYKVEQTAIDAIVDFSDNRLLGSGIWFNKSSVDFPVSLEVIFDNEIFNQDIFVTHSEIDGNEAVNYYIELEAMDLSLDEQTVAVRILRRGVLVGL